MQLIERLIQSVQVGGRINYLKEPSGCLQNFESALVLGIPVVGLTSVQLQTKAMETSFRDSTLVFWDQKHCLELLQSVLQGQIVLVGDLKESMAPADFSFALPKDWKSFWNEVSAGLNSATPLKGFDHSFEKPCLFLDRDDVVVKNVPYNSEPKLVELMPGVVELIQDAHARGFWVALVTNQSGLGRNRIHWGQYQQVHQKMLQLLAAQGQWIDECVWASYIDDAALEAGARFPNLRKPRPGMFQLVNDKLKVNLKESIMVGDSATDLIAAKAAGLRRLVLLDAGKAAVEESKLNQQGLKGEFQVITDFASLEL